MGGVAFSWTHFLVTQQSCGAAKQLWKQMYDNVRFSSGSVGKRPGRSRQCSMVVMAAFWLGSGSTGTIRAVVQMKSAVCPDFPSLILLLAGSRAEAGRGFVGRRDTRPNEMVHWRRRCPERVGDSECLSVPTLLELSILPSKCFHKMS